MDPMSSNAVNGFSRTGRLCPQNVGEVLTLLFSRRARRAVHGLVMLRRAYEHVLVMATLEGVRPVRRPYYEDYVDALNILGARAALIARSL
jgi:hypothetical protein